jgi:hypothetical protein
VEKWLLKFERRLRSDLLSLVLVGVEAEQVGGPANTPLASLLDTERVLVKQVVGRKPPQPLRQKVEMMARNVGLLFGNLRLEF